MNLHVETHGQGAPLLLIHGWGMHGGVWDSLVPRLAEQFQVQVVDLPGHGKSSLGAVGLDAIADQLALRFDEPLAVCGWSLGGQIAMRWAARYPAQVQRLALVTSTPCFAERDDWMFGMDAETLHKFASELEQNHAATLRRFLALQVRGSENERELLTQLRAQLFAHGEPDLAALRGGLEILRDADLRPLLGDMHQPTLAITGERDKLTSPLASYYLAQALPNARVVEIDGAAHAPFLSHPDIFIEHLTSFLHES
ncbi:MAG: pimeloyl-ACP methyl ester esterase BioH [Nitrosomonadales bacterium]|nr:pimeloyl-ACP methyl ester esterase BioH [Nitrosomonadales bacterium]